jgi:predicted phosphodiesterase
VRIAVISDIHGNRLALEAVLDDIARQGVDITVNLGDLLAGPLDPNGVANILRDADFPTVTGNHERTVMKPEKPTDKVDNWVHNRLSPDNLKWLGIFPATMTIERDIFMCHGTPKSDTTPWLDNWFKGRTVTLPDEGEISRAAYGIDFPVLLCGHTHVARSVRLADGRMIVNPGSVGLQLMYGSPDARYAIIELYHTQWSASLRTIPYDHESAARQAEDNGFPGWSKALTSGWLGVEGLF